MKNKKINEICSIFQAEEAINTSHKEYIHFVKVGQLG
jgi:hypothetical protein